MGGNICKWSNPQEIDLQNIETTHAAQYKKKKTNHPIVKKSAEDIDIFPKKTYIWPKSTWKDAQNY